MNMKRTRFSVLAVLAVAWLATGGAIAQSSFPTGPVRIVVPFAAGGVGDVVGRVFADRLSVELGQSVIVENRTGANGALGAQFVATSRPDGHTILQISPAHVILPSVQRGLTYDIEKDLTAFVGTGAVPIALVVSATSNIRTMDDLVALARSMPGGINYGSGGTGSLGHLAPAMLVNALGINATHISYRGNSATVQALLADQVQLIAPTTADVIDLLRGGRVRVLAVTSNQRVPSMPDVPTTAELGLRDFTPTVWYAYLVPARTPREITDRLFAAFAKVAAEPALQERLGALEVRIRISTHDEITRHMQEEAARWRRVVRDNDIRIDN